MGRSLVGWIIDVRNQIPGLNNSLGMDYVWSRQIEHITGNQRPRTMAGRSLRLSVAKVEQALRAHNGLVLQAAEALGIARGTLYKFMTDNPQVDWEEIRSQAGEELLDVAEGHLQSALKDGDMKTIRWYMERKGKNRGYTTRVEQTGMDGGPIEFGVPDYDVVEPTPEAGNDETI